MKCIVSKKGKKLCIPGTSHVSESFSSTGNHSYWKVSFYCILHQCNVGFFQGFLKRSWYKLATGSFLCPNSKREMILFLGLGRYPICHIDICFIIFVRQNVMYVSQFFHLLLNLKFTDVFLKKSFFFIAIIISMWHVELYRLMYIYLKLYNLL